MLRKLLILILLVAAAAVFGLWRMGLLDERKLEDEAAELRGRAEKGAKRAAEEAGKAARDAAEDAKGR